MEIKQGGRRRHHHLDAFRPVITDATRALLEVAKGENAPRIVMMRSVASVEERVTTSERLAAIPARAGPTRRA